MVSVITISHKPKYLSEAYESLKAQTHKDWEWVILLNGAASNWPATGFLADSRIRVLRDKSNNSNIGYLKNKAFSAAWGEILVELDHDDMLTPTCLEEVVKAFTNPSVGFVYSDCAYLDLSKTFIPYDPARGWTFKMVDVLPGKPPMIAMDSFEPTGRSLSVIWYAPNHVRAWRSTTYRELGGHNSERAVLDDHELLIRTYLFTEMKHIPKPLYIYRLSGENSYVERNKEIQAGTIQLFYQFFPALMAREADLRGLLKVDLGGGIDGAPGFLTIDKEGGDVCGDLAEGIPLDDNSVGVLRASHVIEHLPDKLKTMSEIYRVLADGGVALIDVPSTDGRGAFQDPTHVSYWNENSFWYWTRKESARYIKNITVRFQEWRLGTGFPGPWWETNKISVTTAWLAAIKTGAKRPHFIKI